jgi:hypothetical protein
MYLDALDTPTGLDNDKRRVCTLDPALASPMLLDASLTVFKRSARITATSI